MSIYVAMHKNVVIPECSWMVPLGLNGFQSERGGVVDSEGDSIAFLNKNYCELTGTYWLYKNCADPYIGLCHYRRFFSFLPYAGEAVAYPSFLNVPPCQEVFDFLVNPVQEQEMLSIMDYRDVIVPLPVYQAESVRAAFIGSHGARYWDVFEHHCRKIFGSRVGIYNHERKMYYGNMLVARNEIFLNYSKNLFSVIDAVFSEIGDVPDVPGARYQDYRYPGYLAERFMSLYISEAGLRSHEVPVLFIDC